MLSLLFNSKTHATLKNKFFVTLYAEDLYFLTTRAGWKVTKVYDHYTFRQARFKKDFVVTNQNLRKTIKTKVEKDFYKLPNNSKFGNHCRNNINHCSLKLLFDALHEISHLKRFTNIMQDWRYIEIFSLDLMREQIQKEYDKKKKKVNETDPFYSAILESMNRKKEEDFEAIDRFAKKKIKHLQVTKIDTRENKIGSCYDLRKKKMVIELNDHQSSSVKSIAVKSKTSVQYTTRFMSRKLLMFTKLSLKSFVYSLAKLLAFPVKILLWQKFIKNMMLTEFYVIKFSLTQTVPHYNLSLFLT